MTREPLKNRFALRNFHASSENGELATKTYQMKIRRGTMSRLEPKRENYSSKDVFQRFPNIQEIMKACEILLSRVSESADLVYRSLKLPCKKNCSLCCEQLFPVSLVEAYFISMRVKSLDRTQRRELRKKTAKIYEKLADYHWDTYQAFNLDKKTLYEKRTAFANALRNTRISCPLLVKNLCSVYADRPHDCRVHGCSFDQSTHELIACEKFNDRVKNQPNFYEKLMDFNFLYPQLLELDRMLEQTLTLNSFPEKTLYVTTLGIPILHDFTERNWFEFFEKKFSDVKIEENKGTSEKHNFGNEILPILSETRNDDEAVSGRTERSEVRFPCKEKRGEGHSRCSCLVAKMVKLQSKECFSEVPKHHLIIDMND